MSLNENGIFITEINGSHADFHSSIESFLNDNKITYLEDEFYIFYQKNLIPLMKAKEEKYYKKMSTIFQEEIKRQLQNSKDRVEELNNLLATKDRIIELERSKVIRHSKILNYF